MRQPRNQNEINPRGHPKRGFDMKNETDRHQYRPDDRIDQKRDGPAGVCDSFGGQIHVFIEFFDPWQEPGQPFGRHIPANAAKGVHDEIIDVEYAVCMVIYSVNARQLGHLEKEGEQERKQDGPDPARTEVITEHHPERHRQNDVEDDLEKRPFLQQMPVSGRSRSDDRRLF